MYGFSGDLFIYIDEIILKGVYFRGYFFSFVEISLL